MQIICFQSKSPGLPGKRDNDNLPTKWTITNGSISPFRAMAKNIWMSQLGVISLTSEKLMVTWPALWTLMGLYRGCNSTGPSYIGTTLQGTTTWGKGKSSLKVPFGGIC